MTVAVAGDSGRSGSDGAADPVVVLVEDGSVGAGVLALRHAGVVVDQTVFDRLSASLARLRGSALP